MSENKSPFRGTTIVAVKKNGKTAVAGDGQVTMGEHTIMKAGAKKVCRIYNDKVVVGFAGSVADAFALREKFEACLEQFAGNLPRAAVELASNWRQDKAARQLEAMLLAADPENLLLISGTGEVIEPDDGVLAITIWTRKTSAGTRPAPCWPSAPAATLPSAPPARSSAAPTWSPRILSARP